MHNERQAILHLVAAGRLTGAEAERLLTLANDRQDLPWIAALGCALCLAQGHVGTLLDTALRFGQQLLWWYIPALRAAVSALFTHLGR